MERARDRVGVLSAHALSALQEGQSKESFFLNGRHTLCDPTHPLPTFTLRERSSSCTEGCYGEVGSRMRKREGGRLRCRPQGNRRQRVCKAPVEHLRGSEKRLPPPSIKIVIIQFDVIDAEVVVGIQILDFGVANDRDIA